MNLEISKKYGPEQFRNLTLDERVHILKELCQIVDPFLPLSSDMKESLKSVGIENLEDPFQITNRLIFLLEETLMLDQKNQNIH